MENLLMEIRELKQTVIEEMLETRNVVSEELAAVKDKIDNLEVKNSESGNNTALSFCSTPLLFNLLDTHSTYEESLELYSWEEELGIGSKGKVQKITDVLSEKEYAVKIIFLDEYRLTPEMAKEISTLYNIKHENVVKLEEVISYADHLYLFMEHAGVDLNIFLQEKGKQNAEIVKTWLRDLLSALAFIHKKGLVHRDLKPENIIIGSDLKLKIADFGSARMLFDEADLSPAVTTLPFRAPELLLGSDVYGKEIDMWAVGCIFAEMVEGKGLFGFKGRSDSELDILHEIFSKIGIPSPQSSILSLPNFPTDVYKYPEASQILPNLDADGNDLIKKMLKVDPLERITAEDALNHPYLKTKVLFSAFKPLLFVEASEVAEVVQFYKSAFGAKEVNNVMHPKRKADQELPLMCTLKIASTTFLISGHSSNPMNKTGGAGFSFLLETEDIEAAVANAEKAGAVSVGGTAGGEGACSGMRVGKLRDPYGVMWEIISLR